VGRCQTLGFGKAGFCFSRGSCPLGQNQQLGDFVDHDLYPQHRQDWLPNLTIGLGGPRFAWRQTELPTQITGRVERCTGQPAREWPGIGLLFVRGCRVFTEMPARWRSAHNYWRSNEGVCRAPAQLVSNNRRMDAAPTQQWRERYKPEMSWAPRKLPGWLKQVPDWLGRGVAESRFAPEVVTWSHSVCSGPTSLNAGLPDGDGRPVLVIPGFGFGDPATLPLQINLHAAGYQVVRSKILLNVRCSNRTVKDLAEVAKAAVAADDGRKLLVVGHSRGGMIARGLAALYPELVDRAIALGAPLNHEFAFYEAPAPMVVVLRETHQLQPTLRQQGCSTPECTCPYMRATYLPMPAGVELVSVYSKSDGIVDWRACVVPGARNVEVDGSHLGMGLKPATQRVVLEELARSNWI
jgi:triacylglycerol lipase